MIEPGMHINGVGGDCPGKTELHADILHNAFVVVEYEPQSRIEGELQQMPADFQVTELWKILEGHTAGRASAEQVTVFDSVGFALEDFFGMGMGVTADISAAPTTHTENARSATAETPTAPKVPIHA